ncbi:hypothetical protein JW887_02480 [Candidatus Dojkabacteria bacterium]|nr:hypothetical protein [Candidatus Dojkabacteria bacterium]
METSNNVKNKKQVDRQKIRKIIFFNILCINILTVLILLSLGLYIYPKFASTQQIKPQITNSVDKVFSYPGENSTPLGNPDIDELTIYNNSINNEKDEKSLTEITKQTYLQIYEKDGKFITNNILEADASFSFVQDINKIESVNINYSDQNNNLTLTTTEFQLKIDDQETKVLEPITIGEIPNISNKDIIKIDNSFVDMRTANTNKSIVTSGNVEHIKIYKQVSVKNLDNGDFSQGSWQGTVGDCSQYVSGVADLEMNIVNDTQGNPSLSLSSKNHYACTSKQFQMDRDSNKVYLLSFDYKSIEGNYVQAYFEILDEKEKIVSRNTITLTPNDNNWHNHRVILDEIENVEKPLDITIFVYAPSDGSKEVTNFYDNFELLEYEMTQDILLTDKEETTDQENQDSEILERNNENKIFIENITLGSNNNNISILPTNINDYNITLDSFEDKLWQESASDCSSIMAGKPEFELSQEYDASDGEKSLMISSTNHNACVAKLFDIDINNTYLYKLSVDMKALKDKKSQVYYYFEYMLNGQVKYQSGVFNIDAPDNKWHSYSTTVIPPDKQILNFGIFLYALSDGTYESQNLYDNIKLNIIGPKNLEQFYFINEKEIEEMPEAEVKLAYSNRFETRFYVSDIKSNEFLVILPQEYSSTLELQIKGDNINKTIENSNHYQGYGLGTFNNNVWLINKNELCTKGCSDSDQYTIIIREKKFFMIQIVVAALIPVTATILIISIVKERKKNLKT